MTTTTGVIASLAGERGFGFIQADGGGRFFFPATARERGVSFASLYERQRVSFEATEAERGPRAERVVLVDG